MTAGERPQSSLVGRGPAEPVARVQIPAAAPDLESLQEP